VQKNRRKKPACTLSTVLSARSKVQHSFSSCIIADRFISIV
jgi:hypothetical protein